MTETASSRYQVSVEPAAPRSPWRRFAFPRLSLDGSLAAGAVAKQVGQARPSTFSGSRIVVRDAGSGDEVWQVSAADLSGGTSPDQLYDDVERDLDVLSVDDFRHKYGIAG